MPPDALALPGIGICAGLRPLLHGESDSTSKLSREHAVSSPVRGLTMIAGGKYTTYRVMAKDAVDAAVHGLERVVPASCTERIPLSGANGYLGEYNSRHLTAERTVVSWCLGLTQHEHSVDTIKFCAERVILFRCAFCRVNVFIVKGQLANFEELRLVACRELRCQLGSHCPCKGAIA